VHDQFAVGGQPLAGREPPPRLSHEFDRAGEHQRLGGRATGGQATINEELVEPNP
jgi:hypothetical protein